jgi:hypothetical protein
MPAPGFRAVERFRRVDYPPADLPPVGECLWCRSMGIRPPDETVQVRGVTSAAQGQAIRAAWTVCGHWDSVSGDHDDAVRDAVHS